jgi:hypothetical protein
LHSPFCSEAAAAVAGASLQVLTRLHNGHLHVSSLAGMDEPVSVFLYAYQVLAACNYSRAQTFLEVGRRYVHHRAILLDEENRERYLSAVPANRAILEE